MQKVASPVILGHGPFLVPQLSSRGHVTDGHGDKIPTEAASGKSYRIWDVGQPFSSSGVASVQYPFYERRVPITVHLWEIRQSSETRLS
jgi:hypothetical protein